MATIYTKAFPTPLPGGRRFLFLREAGPQSGIYAGSLDAKPEEQTRKRLLPDDSAPLFVPGRNGREGTLLFFRGGTLMAQTLDPVSLELKGEAVAVAQNLSDEINYSASDDGKLAYVAARQGQRQLAWYDLQGKFLENVGPPQNALKGARISPDGTRLAFSRDEPDDRSDIFVLNLGRASETRVTSGPANNDYPVWSPDGTQVAFVSNRDNAMNLYVRAADGSGNDQLLLKDGDRKIPQDWSPDGKFLLFAVATPHVEDLWTLALTSSSGGPKTAPYLPKGGRRFNGRFSPDGHFVAYSSPDSGGSEVYVSPFDPASLSAPAPGAAQVKVSLYDGNLAAWRADGKQLLYLTKVKPRQIEGVGCRRDSEAIVCAGIPQPLVDIRPEESRSRRMQNACWSSSRWVRRNPRSWSC